MIFRRKSLLIAASIVFALSVAGIGGVAVFRGGGKGLDAILARARSGLESGKLAEAEIEYRRAIQIEGRDPGIYRELARVYDRWIKTAPTELVSKYEALRRSSLSDEAKYGPDRIEPRRSLLAEAIDKEDRLESVRWSNEIIRLEPTDPDANAVLAGDKLAGSSPDLAAIRLHLGSLERLDPKPPRAEWLGARLALADRDEAALKIILVASRSRQVDSKVEGKETLALFRLRSLDVQRLDPVERSTILTDRVQAAIEAGEDIVRRPNTSAGRLAIVCKEMQSVQRGLRVTEASADSPLRSTLETLDRRVETLIERIFAQTLASNPHDEGALAIYLAHADHLRSRDDRAGCLSVIEKAFNSGGAIRQSSSDVALALHALAVHANLTDAGDPSRFDRALPHVKPLLNSTHPRFRAFGHMYQGQIELEGIDLIPSASEAKSSPNETTSREKLRSSALAHLKQAADALGELSEAQARYGVALILCRETELGRVYLQKAARLGPLEARYQIWAAWAMIHNGYPEYAEPIVSGLLAEVDAGRLPRGMGGVLYLVEAEIHQNRRSPEELGRALSCYQKAFAAGQEPTAIVQLRIAQIELALKRPEDALARIDAMARAKLGGAAREVVAVTTLRGQGKEVIARDRLRKARIEFPSSSELLAVEAETLVAEGKAVEADALLAARLVETPDDLALVELRAWILSGPLRKMDEARAILVRIAERVDRSSPLVRVAQLDLARHDYDAAAATIAQIRGRWREAAVADMLDAQVALAKGDRRLASRHYDAALRKDPGNKLVQYWKAQVDAATDPKRAAKVLQTLANEGSTKEIDDGTSLMMAARCALATLQFEGGDAGAAIRLYGDLLKEGASGDLARDLRWKIVAARVASRDWPAARSELEFILRDPISPPSRDERVAAAIYFRDNGDETKAVGLLDEILIAFPNHAWAVAVRTQMQLASGRPGEAKALILRAIAACGKGSETPAAFHLLLAAVEYATPPVAEGLNRALAAVERGLGEQPRSLELVKARCRLLGLLGKRGVAITSVESLTREDPHGPFPRLLMSLHAEAGEYPAAERVAAQLRKEHPEDRSLAAATIRLAAARSIEASARGDRSSAVAIDARIAESLREFRAKFADDPTFLQLDSELAARRGETARAIALTREIDAMRPGSTVGPLLRAQIYARSNQGREVAASYEEAIAVDPNQPAVRLLLAQADFHLGEFDKAEKDANLVLAAEPGNPTAILVEARALATKPGSPAEVVAGRTRAIEHLDAAIRERPTFSDAHHLLAEILLMQGDRGGAVDRLKMGLEGVPGDADGLCLAIRILCETKTPGQASDPSRLALASTLAERFAGPDSTGTMAHAVAVGFHRGGCLELGLPWGRRAAELSTTKPVHLNYGDMLLSTAESVQGDARRDVLQQAIREFDQVLKLDPVDPEAVNNKVWILHSYLGRHAEALGIVEAFLSKVDVADLPAEFFDTLGSIQEAVGRPRDAEESYRSGLAKSPDMPAMNFRMARLIASDPGRVGNAAPYLARALAGQNGLTDEMQGQLAVLSGKINR